MTKLQHVLIINRILLCIGVDTTIVIYNIIVIILDVSMPLVGVDVILNMMWMKMVCKG